MERSRRRMSPTNSWLRALELTAPIGRNPSRIFPIVIEELAEEFNQAIALLSDQESMTYGALAKRMNQYARWALAEGLARGETVCLLMPNRPEYLAIWLGIARMGGVVSLLNTSITGKSLAHCIDIVKPIHIIVAAELMESLTAARAFMASDCKTWAFGDAGSAYPRIERIADGYEGTKLADTEILAPTIEDRALYVYTSGTTGYPKAANISHYRLMNWSHWFAGMMDTRPSDRMYDCLPMYHSIGGIAAIGSVLVKGGSVVIRQKFSASQFWHDIARWNCTLFQYIGELCRYLLHAPPNLSETSHRLRLCCGNGLRPDVWDNFKSRFNIPQILEFYAATEGNISLFNCEGKTGSIGRIPTFLAHRFPIALVKYDAKDEKPVRNEQGFCIRCAPNEIGEALGKLPDDLSKVGARFEGYASKEDTAAKILRDVFVRGDAWYRTGDLMRIDKQGYFYFVNRVGDTFRWKGENVATSEVCETITALRGITEAIVYGVKIPGTDGRAGMATIVVDSDFSVEELRKHLAEKLPAYARPMFLRVRSEIELTPTFKYSKERLLRDGYDPNASADVIYFYDTKANAFVKMDDPLYRRIQSEFQNL